MDIAVVAGDEARVEIVEVAAWHISESVENEIVVCPFGGEGVLF